ncbi:unnamed protein product [Arctogadus glacialis]
MIHGQVEKGIKNVIHTVGPMARGRAGPSESSDLSACYQNSLKLLVDHNLTTVITRVIFCVFLDTDYDIYKEKMAELFQERMFCLAQHPLTPTPSTTPTTPITTTLCPDSPLKDYVPGLVGGGAGEGDT